MASTWIDGTSNNFDDFTDWTGVHAVFPDSSKQVQTLLVANGSVVNNKIPIDGYNAYLDQHNQFLYPSSLLTSMVGMEITNMVFYFDNNYYSFYADDVENGRLGEWSFSLGEVTDGALQGFDDSTLLFTCYSGTMIWNHSNRTVTVTFDNPYYYNGGNLLVDITHYEAGSSRYYFYGTTLNGASVSYRDQFADTVTSQNFLPKTQFSFSDALSCHVPANIAIDSIWYGGLSLSWDSVAPSTSWQVEYGLHRYTTLPKTTVITSIPSISVSGLSANLSYDFRLRTICGEGDSSRWINLTITLPRVNTAYWKDIVTSQPDGYKIGSDNNVYIYDNEGLAWLISVCNRLNGASGMSYNTRKITLMADVDMSGYRWTPIDLPYNIKVFDGGFHVIEGLTISEDSLSRVGFFEWDDDDDTIINTVFKNCNIYSGYEYGGAGCITGGCYGNIINCGVAGVIVSNKYGGGIAGTTWGSASILNCYSTAIVEGKSYIGGAIGSSRYTMTSFVNCYSAAFVDCDKSSKGVFVGTANDTTSQLAYWIQRKTTDVGCGNNVDGLYPFMGSDTSWNLLSEITIEGHNVSSLVEALNAWVDANNTEGICHRWVNDSDNSNLGYPTFEVEKCHAHVVSQDTNKGVVMGGGQYVENTAINVCALAKDCYHFSHWNDGNTDNPRLILLSEDTMLTAYFATNNEETYDTLVIGDQELPYLYGNDTIVEAGIYDIVVTAEDGCDSVVHLQVVVEHRVVGIVEISEDGILIFPNPTSGLMTVMATQEIQCVVIYDEMGRMVKEIALPSQVDIKDLPNGTYTLRIIFPQGQTIRKIVKK